MKSPAPRLALTAVAILAAGLQSGAVPPTPDPFAFLEPSVRVSASERARLDAGDPIARTLPGDDGHVALFAAVRLSAPPERLIDWTREIEQFKRGPLVRQVGRFSTPVADDDLDALTLDENELDALRDCREGNCAAKLAAPEIAEIREAIHAAGSGWRDAAQRAFRRVLIARVRLHQERGLLALPPYADRSRRLSVGEAFSSIAARSAFLRGETTGVVNSLIMPRLQSTPGVESLYYWSQDSFGKGRPVVNVTYVRLLTPSASGGPSAMTVSAQLYASHYIVGSIAVTAAVCDEARASCYLAYLNRTQVDFLGGLFGAFKRAMVEGRLESEAPALIVGVRRRLESGRPRPPEDGS